MIIEKTLKRFDPNGAERIRRVVSGSKSTLDRVESRTASRLPNRPSERSLAENPGGQTWVTRVDLAFRL